MNKIPEAVSMKQAQKIGQAYRREFRRVLAIYTKELQSRLSVFNKALKPRPRWIPRAVWRWCGNIFIDVNAINTLVDPLPPVPEIDESNV